MSGPENDQRYVPSPATLNETPRDDTSQLAGPLSYFREAVRIARFDLNAIGRASQDRSALFYGACFLTIGLVAAQLAGRRLSGLTPGELPVSSSVAVVVVLILALPVQILLSALNIALIHGAAKFLFGATGRYVALLRVLWLASIVQWLSIIPVIGVLVGGVWFLLITLVTFEEIDGVERLQALMLVVGFAALTVVLTALLT
jgi:hypothetical protein